jgi:hypothetical protein
MMMIEIKPIPDSPQERFCQSSVRELGFGGAAGGAKSYGLILDALYQLDKPGYDAIIFRRTYKQLMEASGLIDYSRQVFPVLGGIFNQSTYTWRFPQYHNNSIRFSYIEREADIEQHAGSAYAYVGYDQLDGFTERQYLYLFSRNRATNPDIKLYVRSTFNPGGVGHHWVKKRFIQPFQNGTGFITDPKYFKRVNGQDIETGKNDRLAISRLFIPSRLEDNPYLWQDGKGDYERNLSQLDATDYQRLRYGDWDARREGRVYHSFTDANIASDVRDLDVSKIAGYYHSHDFGAVNHIWGLWAKIGSQYYLVHEQQLPEGTTSSKAKHIKRVFGDKKIVVGYGGSGSENQYRLDFGREGVIIRLPSVPKKTPQDQIVEYQVRKTNRFFEQKTLMICSDMVMTIDQLENCVRDEKEGIQDKAQWHYCDMVRYFSSGLGMGVFVG